MKKILLILFLVCSLFLVYSPVIAQDAKVTSLMSKPLPDIARNPYGRTDVLRRPQRYSHSWSQREQDDASQVLGSLAQRQRCTCSDSGEVALAAKTSRQRQC